MLLGELIVSEEMVDMVEQEEFGSNQINLFLQFIYQIFHMFLDQLVELEELLLVLAVTLIVMVDTVVLVVVDMVLVVVEAAEEPNMMETPHLVLQVVVDLAD